MGFAGMKFSGSSRAVGNRRANDSKIASKTKNPKTSL